MGTCCNSNCNYYTKRVRCGKCRKKLISNCISCDVPVWNPNKFYCHECASFSKLRWSRVYQRDYKREKRINNSIVSI